MEQSELLKIKWMRRAINLASLGKGLTSPNPLVGAVIINESGVLISEGFHYKAGSPHAEAMAFNNLKSDPHGGSLYVNLEPCCHHGRTPPCVDKIIRHGIKKVFIALKDPDSRVSGMGIKILKDEGINIELGICEKEAFEINKCFIHRCLTGETYGVLKWAMSIDGRIGLKNGKSKWITNTFSRSLVHSIRRDFDAIIIGGNTLRKDNPFLTTRGTKSPEPLRVVFTRTLDFPRKANFWDAKQSKTLVVFGGSQVDERKLVNIPKWVDVEKIPSDNPKHLMKLLAEKGCNNVLWECGPKLATSALKNNCVQEVLTFIAPKILGGIDSMNPITDLQFKDMKDIIKLNKLDVKFIEDDILVQSSLNHSFKRN